MVMFPFDLCLIYSLTHTLTSLLPSDIILLMTAYAIYLSINVDAKRTARHSRPPHLGVGPRKYIGEFLLGSQAWVETRKASGSGQILARYGAIL